MPLRSGHCRLNFHDQQYFTEVYGFRWRRQNQDRTGPDRITDQIMDRITDQIMDRITAKKNKVLKKKKSPKKSNHL